MVAPVLIVAPRVREDRLGVEAGSITYGAFLSLPPLLLLLIAGTAFVFADDPSAQAALLDSVERMVPGLEQAVTSQLSIPKGGQLGIGLVGIVGLVWAASGFAARARIALGAIFRGPPGGLIFGRFSAALVGVPVFIGIVGLTVATGLVANLELTGIAAWAARTAFDLVFLLASVGFFLVVYWALTPRGLVPIRKHLPGAIAFAIAWAILGRVGGIYVVSITSRSAALYGVIGALFGVLAFIYVSMWCFLLAAEFTQASAERRRNGP